MLVLALLDYSPSSDSSATELAVGKSVNERRHFL